MPRLSSNQFPNSFIIFSWVRACLKIGLAVSYTIVKQVVSVVPSEGVELSGCVRSHGKSWLGDPLSGRRWIFPFGRVAPLVHESECEWLNTHNTGPQFAAQTDMCICKTSTTNHNTTQPTMLSNKMITFYSMDHLMLLKVFFWGFYFRCIFFLRSI